jgi:hypothetical protein
LDGTPPAKLDGEAPGAIERKPEVPAAITIHICERFSFFRISTVVNTRSTVRGEADYNIISCYDDIRVPSNPHCLVVVPSEILYNSLVRVSDSTAD